MTDRPKDTPANRLKLAKCIVESMPASQHTEAIERLLFQWESVDGLWQTDYDDWLEEMARFDEEIYDEMYQEETQAGDRWDGSTLADFLHGSLEEINDQLANEEEK